MTNKQFVSSLRQIADFYAKNQELEVPYFGYSDTFSVYPGIEAKKVVPKFARAFGSCEKGSEYGLYFVRKQFGSIWLSVSTRHEDICERVVVGTKRVEDQTVPEIFVAAHDEDIVEWKCPDSLLMET